MKEETAAKARELWSRACEEIRAKIPERIYAQWFDGIVPVRADDRKITLGVPDEIYEAWVRDNFSDIITDSLKKTAGGDLQFELETGHKADFPEAEESETAKVPDFGVPAAEGNGEAGHRTQGSTAPNCLAEYTFDNFIVGEENRYAYSAALTAAKEPGKFNPLYIYGSTGMGKTHLIQAVANHVHASRPDAVVRYVTCEAFLNAYLDSLHTHSTFKSHFEFRNYYRGVDVLLVDDVHQLGGKDQIQEEFFNTFNTLYNEGKQIILTSDKQPSEIRGLEARLVTRFESGVTTQITSPTTFETRLSILQYEQREQQIKLPPDVIHYVAERISSSIRALKGALMRLVFYSSIMGEPVSRDKAEGLLSDQLDTEAENRKVTVDRIQQIVAEQFQLRISDLTGSKRPKNIAEPRMMAMYFAREMTDLSLMDIGNAFGGRNHATVLHAVAQVKKLSDSNEEFRRNLTTLKRKIQG
ncbi:MAG: chromosomal replication initiator protein DnaA [Lentisphaeria bacterium]|nr:chromosomal replication initiator protein DnaA [Lentisphaeria bacterium]